MFFVTVPTTLRTGTAPSGAQRLTVTLRVLNRGRHPLSLAYIQGSGHAWDEQGTHFGASDSAAVHGIDLIRGINVPPVSPHDGPPPTFTVAPGAARDLSLDLVSNGPTRPPGTRYRVALFVQRVDVASDGDSPRSRVRALRFANLTTGPETAAAAARVLAAASAITPECAQDVACVRSAMSGAGATPTAAAPTTAAPAGGTETATTATPAGPTTTAPGTAVAQGRRKKRGASTATTATASGAMFDSTAVDATSAADTTGGDIAGTFVSSASGAVSDAVLGAAGGVTTAATTATTAATTAATDAATKAANSANTAVAGKTQKLTDFLHRKLKH